MILVIINCYATTKPFLGPTANNIAQSCVIHHSDRQWFISAHPRCSSARCRPTSC